MADTPAPPSFEKAPPGPWDDLERAVEALVATGVPAPSPAELRFVQMQLVFTVSSWHAPPTHEALRRTVGQMLHDLRIEADLRPNADEAEIERLLRQLPRKKQRNAFLAARHMRCEMRRPLGPRAQATLLTAAPHRLREARANAVASPFSSRSYVVDTDWTKLADELGL